jgi:hypothetical protein
MKASNFTLNSDFLSIAQVNSKEFTVYVGGGTLMPEEQSVQEFSFRSPTQNGCIDRIMIKKDASNYMVGYYLSCYPDVIEAYWVDSDGNKHYIDGTGLLLAQLIIYRSDKNTLNAKLVIWTNATYATITYSSMTFNIKISSFKVPNVF